MPTWRGAVTPIEGIEILPKLSRLGTTAACVGAEEENEMSDTNSAAVTAARKYVFIADS
jgi:hypothetical protein